MRGSRTSQNKKCREGGGGGARFVRTPGPPGESIRLYTSFFVCHDSRLVPSVDCTRTCSLLLIYFPVDVLWPPRLGFIGEKYRSAQRVASSACGWLPGVACCGKRDGDVPTARRPHGRASARPKPPPCFTTRRCWPLTAIGACAKLLRRCEARARPRSTASAARAASLQPRQL